MHGNLYRRNSTCYLHEKIPVDVMRLEVNVSFPACADSTEPLPSTPNPLRRSIRAPHGQTNLGFFLFLNRKPNA
jgi:hypothetical protein